MDTPQKTRESGFTVIELIFIAVVFAVAGVVAFVQINNLRIANQDTQRKTAINAMHYALEEVYYKKYQGYPTSLTSSKLPSIDPELFTDPDGFTLGKEALSEEELQELIENGNASPELEQRLASLNAGKQPNYHYEPTDCDTSTNLCKGYTLKADLVGEAQYVKKNRSR